MRYLKLLPALMLAFLLAACEPQDQEGEEAMDEAMQESEQAMDEAGDAMDEAGDAQEGTWESAGEETQEAASEAWEATKDTAGEAWEGTKEAFQGDMTPEEKAAFDACVQDMIDKMAVTEDEAQRGCREKMQEGMEMQDEGMGDTGDEGEG